MESSGRESTGKVPPVPRSRPPSVGIIIEHGLLAFVVGAMLGVLFCYRARLFELFK